MKPTYSKNSNRFHRKMKKIGPRNLNGRDALALLAGDLLRPVAVAVDRDPVLEDPRHQELSLMEIGPRGIGLMLRRIARRLRVLITVQELLRDPRDLGLQITARPINLQLQRKVRMGRPLRLVETLRSANIGTAFSAVTAEIQR